MPFENTTLLARNNPSPRWRIALMADEKKTNLVLDDDVHKVIEFMQAEIPAARLVAVAAGIAQLAPIVWEEYQQEPVQPLRLRYR
jgi:hypothetical protein